MKNFLIILLISVSAISGQVEQSAGKNLNSSAPDFFIDFASYRSSQPEKTRFDVFIRMPYSSVQFIKSGDIYTGGYSIFLTFFDEDKENVVFERIWTEKVSVNEFIQTASSTSFNLSYRSTDLVPDTYILQIMVEDNNSSKSVKFDFPVEVEEYDKPLAMSDFILIEKRIPDEKGERIIPKVSDVITSDEKSLDLFFEIYSSEPATAFLRYTVENIKSGEKATKFEAVTLKAGDNKHNYLFEGMTFGLGKYTMIVELESEENKKVDSKMRSFNALIPGFPTSINDLDKAIEQMVYIASSQDVDSLMELENYELKLEKFKEYWKKKDPSPNTENNEVLREYYRRVAYANQNFKSYYEGWKTDMGMIYITLGAPSQVDRHPFEYDSKPYEIWDYYDLNRRFIFLDQTGFGDYRLLNPVYGDWYRYRY